MIRPLLVVLVLLCLLAEASADKRVAVATIEGDQGGAVTKIMVAALDGEGDYLVITPKAVTKVADELAIAIDDRQAGKLMEELEADALVMGTVEPIQGGNRLILRVVAKGAKKSRSATVLYGKKAASGRVRTSIREAITTLLASGAEPAIKGGESGEEVTGERLPRGGSNDGPTTLRAEGEEEVAPRPGGEREPRVVPKRAITGGTGKRDKRFVTFKEDQPAEAEATKGLGDAEDPNGEEGEEDEPRAKPAGRRVIAARIAAGPSISTRTLEFSRRAFDQAPKDYRNSFVPGARVQGEIYPVAFVSKGFLANIGIGFEFDQTIGLKVNSGGMKLPTTVRHFSVDARIRIPLGGGSISLVGGYGQRTFKVTRGQTMLDLPNIDYKLFDPGLAFRVPIGPVALFGEARALLMTAAGEIQTNASYGPGTVSAFETEAGLEVEITRAIGVRLSGDFVGVGYDFKGTGALSNNRDQDPATVDVGGAAERYIGGALALSVRY